MFNPIFLLTLLPTWLAAFYLVRLLQRRREAPEGALEPARARRNQ